MSRIDDLIQRHCPNGVEYRALGEVVRNLDRDRRPITGSQRVAGDYPYYGANGVQDWVDGFLFDGTFLLMGEDGSVVDHRGSPVLTWATGKIWVNNHAHVLVARDDSIDLRYLYFFLQTVNIRGLITGSAQPKLNQAKMNQIRVAVPPVEVQREVVRVLDLFQSLEAELEAELEARRRQFAHYRDSLLQSGQVAADYLPLSAVALDFGRGKSRHRPRNDPKLYGGSYPFIQTGDIRSCDHQITGFVQAYNEQGLAQSKLWPRGTICITIAANIAETGILGFDACFPDSVIGLVVDPARASNHYVEYLLQSLKHVLAAKGQGSAQDNINLGTFEKQLFPIPSLAEQERIVAVLDKFDALVNDLSVGLPAELAARRKQYEYYRDRLLTFDEAV